MCRELNLVNRNNCVLRTIDAHYIISDRDVDSSNLDGLISTIL